MLALDLGSRRIGVAVGDTTTGLALPRETIERCGDDAEDLRRIVAEVADAGAEAVVVGLPLSMDGSRGPAARRYEREAQRLGRELAVPVETYDERLSTVSADRMLTEAGMDGRAKRKVVDTVAATVILQGWLDRHAASGGRPATSPDASAEDWNDDDRP